MWIDFIIVLAFVLYVTIDYRRGFLRLTAELVGLILAFIIALKNYTLLSNIFANQLHFPKLSAKSLGFLIIWFAVQIFFYFIGRFISVRTPLSVRRSSINTYLGILPAMAKAVIFLGVMLLLFVIAPIDGPVKTALEQSTIGKNVIGSAVRIEKELEMVFSEDQSLTIETNKLDESSKLNFTTNNGKIDELGETQILQKINQDRVKTGRKPLVTDILMRNVARAHSRDMLQKGYFAHNSPDGQGLFDRLTLANVKFKTAAENIALSPTIDLVHIGLMNSPKHRENILDQSFTHIGIGIIDAGPYGLMVTENFAN